jgi:hypothetical protein
MILRGFGSGGECSVEQWVPVPVIEHKQAPAASNPSRAPRSARACHAYYPPHISKV